LTSTPAFWVKGKGKEKEKEKRKKKEKCADEKMKGDGSCCEML